MPELPPGEIHIWTADLDLVETALSSGVLSDDERTRAAKFRSAADRRRFAASRAVLRILIGRYLGKAPRDVSFRYSPAGKPSVDGALGFNVSHSENLFVAAFAVGAEVGVDVETVRPELVDDATASFALSETERSAMNASPNPVGYFFGCWTRKEAIVKATGDGFASDPSAIDTENQPNNGFRAFSLALFDRAASAFACDLASPRTAVFRFPENLEARTD